MDTQSKHLDARVSDFDPEDEEILDLVDAIPDDEEILELTDEVTEDSKTTADVADVASKDSETLPDMSDLLSEDLFPEPLPDSLESIPETDDRLNPGIGEEDLMVDADRIPGVEDAELPPCMVEEELFPDELLPDAGEKPIHQAGILHIDEDKDIFIEEIESALPEFPWEHEMEKTAPVEEDILPERIPSPEPEVGDHSGEYGKALEESGPQISDKTRKMLESLELSLAMPPIASVPETEQPESVASVPADDHPVNHAAPVEPPEPIAPPVSLPVETSLSLTEEQVESALERVIRRMFAEKIEIALEQAVAQVVREEMQHVKKLILEETGNP